MITTTVTCPDCQGPYLTCAELPPHATSTVRRCPACNALLILDWASGTMQVRVSGINNRPRGISAGRSMRRPTRRATGSSVKEGQR